MKNNKILDSDQIERKFQRMARQLLEAHHSESEVIIMGVEGQGKEVALRLQSILDNIGKLKTDIKNIKLDKENPLSQEDVAESIAGNGKGLNIEPKNIIQKWIFEAPGPRSLDLSILYRLPFSKLKNIECQCHSCPNSGFLMFL